MSNLLLPPTRLVRWLDNFERRHGRTEMGVEEGALIVQGDDGSRAAVQLPWGRG